MGQGPGPVPGEFGLHGGHRAPQVRQGVLAQAVGRVAAGVAGDADRADDLPVRPPHGDGHRDEPRLDELVVDGAGKIGVPARFAQDEARRAAAGREEIADAERDRHRPAAGATRDEPDGVAVGDRQ